MMIKLLNFITSSIFGRDGATQDRLSYARRRLLALYINFPSAHIFVAFAVFAATDDHIHETWAKLSI